jgi:hypothetical protein
LVLQEKLSETEEATRRKTEGMKLRDEKHREEAAQKEAKDIEAERYKRSSKPSSSIFFP